MNTMNTASSTTVHRRLFRQAAIDRLDTPEQLDDLVGDVPLRAWLFLAPLVVLAASTLAWSWFGTVYTTIKGPALLLSNGGVSDTEPNGRGRLAEFSVQVGDIVQKGQTVGIVVQPELDDRIRRAQLQLQQLSAVDADKARARAIDDEAARALADQQRTSLNRQMQVMQDRVANLRERLQTQQKLLADGLVTAQQVTSTQFEIGSAEVQIESLRGDMRQVELHQSDRLREGRNESSTARAGEAELEHEIESLNKQQHYASRIVASATGRVVEVLHNNGDLVEPGQDVLIIEGFMSDAERRDIPPLTARAYLPIAEGKKVREGMPARVTPATVAREEAGYMSGWVLSVSPFPVNESSIRLHVQSTALAQSILAHGAVIEVRIRLYRADTPSGFRWSTAAGPNFKLASGTPASVEVIAREQRPIELALPFVRRLLGEAQ